MHSGPSLPAFSPALLGALAALASPLLAVSPGDSASKGPSSADWTAFGVAEWTVAKADAEQVFRASGAPAAGAFAYTRELPGADTENGFTVSTIFRVTRPTANPPGEYIGLAAFATQPNLAGASYYVADVQRSSGIVRIISLGAPNPDFASPENGEAFGALEEGKDYTLTLAAARAGDALQLRFTLSDGVRSLTIGASDPTPLTGRQFGFRLNNTSADDPLAVVFSGLGLTPLGTSTR